MWGKWEAERAGEGFGDEFTVASADMRSVWLSSGLDGSGRWGWRWRGGLLRGFLVTAGGDVEAAVLAEDTCFCD